MNTQNKILLKLYEKAEPITIIDLLKETNWGRSNTYVMITHLLANDLVEIVQQRQRRKKKGNKRIYYRLTKKGIEFIKLQKEIE